MQPGENGGIKGHVVYASTRPFDDPQMLVQTQWEPLVPHVTINLYQEGTAADGTQSLTLVDTTQTSSFDDWAQGFRSDGMPNMNCPGQITRPILFYFSLKNQPNYLDYYNKQLHGGSTAPPRCRTTRSSSAIDGMHNWNQVQPAPYDGMYQFPSVTGIDPLTGKPTGDELHDLHCTNLTLRSDRRHAHAADRQVRRRSGGSVRAIELVKEEDKNILIGDNFIAPVTQEFGGLAGSVFILARPSLGRKQLQRQQRRKTRPTSLGATPINQARSIRSR